VITMAMTPRIPMSAEQKAELAELLSEVPNQKVVTYDWTSPAGRAFIKKVREVQIKGSVPLPWIAQALEISKASLSGAIGYWERSSATRASSASRRRREKRVLGRKGAEGAESEE